MNQTHSSHTVSTGVRLVRPVLLAALSLTIPAFYLVLTVSQSGYHNLGRALYACVSLIVVLDLGVQLRSKGKWFGAWRQIHIWRRCWPEVLIFLGALLSSIRADAVWSLQEWLWRLLYCALVFVRLSMLLSSFVAPNRLTQIFAIAAVMLVLAGGCFYWLEPNVHSLADGMWLAFTTVSTVGYGDIAPSSPAARIFAVFIVLLGYALFSVVTASIAALFIGEDEKRLERELHADIRALRAEVAALRQDLQKSDRVRAKEVDKTVEQE